MDIRTAPPTHPTKRPSASYKVPKFVVLPIVGVIALGFIAAYFLLIPHGQRIDTSAYQVVYLANNQAYFGKLQNSEGEYLVIKSPYTAQDVTQPVDEKDKDAEPQTQTTLVKVRDQVAGPQDSIAIRSDQVLFWQNLRSDSKVTTAIDAKK